MSNIPSRRGGFCFKATEQDQEDLRQVVGGELFRNSRRAGNASNIFTDYSIDLSFPYFLRFQSIHSLPYIIIQHHILK